MIIRTNANISHELTEIQTQYEVANIGNNILIKKSEADLMILASEGRVCMERNRRAGKTCVALKDVDISLNLTIYFSDLEKPLQTGVKWLPVIINGWRGREILTDILRNIDHIKPLIDAGLFIAPDNTAPISKDERTDIAIEDYSIFTDIVKTLADYVDRDIIGKLAGNIVTHTAPNISGSSLTLEEKRRTRKAFSIMRQYASFDAVYTAFGYSGGRGLISALMEDESMTKIPLHIGRLVPNKKNIYGLQWERIAEYLTKERVRQGYTLDNQGVTIICIQWARVLKTLHQARNGNIPENVKYPGNLVTLAQSLCVYDEDD